MNKNANLILNRNLYWHLRDIIETDNSNLVYGTDYNVVSAYPDLETIPVYPTFVIMTVYADGLAYEIGAKDRVILNTDIIVLANDIAQNDYYNMVIWNAFHNKDIALYDMSSTNPSSVGDYTGLSTLGKYRCYDVNYANSEAAIYMPDKSMNYESTINMRIELPQI
jgi:hypothetical protein